MKEVENRSIKLVKMKRNVCRWIVEWRRFYHTHIICGSGNIKRKWLYDAHLWQYGKVWQSYPWSQCPLEGCEG
jgi:hypothetical protein